MNHVQRGQNESDPLMATKKQIEDAAAYYARASAVRAVHGHLPEPDPEADAKVWRKTIKSIQDERRATVARIFQAAGL
jgi:hypothetical protein